MRLSISSPSASRMPTNGDGGWRSSSSRWPSKLPFRRAALPRDLKVSSSVPSSSSACAREWWARRGPTRLGLIVITRVEAGTGALGRRRGSASRGSLPWTGAQALSDGHGGKRRAEKVWQRPSARADCPRRPRLRPHSGDFNGPEARDGAPPSPRLAHSAFGTSVLALRAFHRVCPRRWLDARPCRRPAARERSRSVRRIASLRPSRMRRASARAPLCV